MPASEVQVHRGSYVSVGLMASIVVGAIWVLLQLNALRNEFSPRLASMETALISISSNISEMKSRMGNSVTHEELKLHLAPLEARIRALEGR